MSVSGGMVFLEAACFLTLFAPGLVNHSEDAGRSICV